MKRHGEDRYVEVSPKLCLLRTPLTPCKGRAFPYPSKNSQGNEQRLLCNKAFTSDAFLPLAGQGVGKTEKEGKEEKGKGREREKGVWRGSQWEDSGFQLDSIYHTKQPGDPLGLEVS